MSFRALVTSYADRLASLAPWALPLKLILGAVLGALGGAGLLGVLSEYATYSYAVQYGFRPPLEGIPYLKATVTLASFLLLLTGALVFLLSLLFVRSVVWSLEIPLTWATRLKGRATPGLTSAAQSFRTVSDRLARRPVWQVFMVALVISSMTGAFAFFEIAVLNDLGPPPKNSIDPVHASMVGALYGLVLTLVMVNRRAIWWLGGISTLAYFLVWIWMLFSPSWYASFLRTVGYGGGLPISIELREQTQESPLSNMKCNLLLRTTEALLVSPIDSSEVVEIPRDQIRTVTHLGGGLRHLPYRLPDIGPLK
jgi:hypothetical protein